MEQELKIAELATLWNVSVPTTWNRIRKEGLTTFIKKNESNKEVNYVRISDEIINQYVINDVNNVNNLINNGYYEDMLINNNVNNNVKNPQSQLNRGFSNDDIKDFINTLTTVNNDYNNRLQQLTDRLITAESKTLLLEDKASREGIYINEINELKRVNNRNKVLITTLITLIITLIIAITGYITFNIGLNNSSVIKDSVTAAEQSSITESIKKEPAQATKPAPAITKR